MRSITALALTFALGLLPGSCSNSGSNLGSGSGGSGGATTGSGGHASGGNGSGGTTSTGGTTASGGNSGSGGTTASGGNSGSGGTTGSGGTSGSGGATSSGGSTGTGGTMGSGGDGGRASTGGSTGSGGASGPGGIGGRSGGTGGVGTGGAATGGAGGGSSGSGFFSADFESDTAGMQPAGWDNFIAYNYKATNPMGGLSAVADGTHTHNGSKLAAHFKSDGGMVFLERPLPSGTNHLFVRAYFYMTRQLGMGPSGANHESLLGIRADPKSADTEVRFGEIKGVVGTNHVPSDDIAPVMAKWYGPPVISANGWHCIEVEFNGAATYNALNAWSDGTLVHSITQASDWAHAPPGEPANWMSGMFNTVFFGWQSFSSAGNEIWMDDLVMSTARINCN